MDPFIATYRHQLLTGPARILPGDDGVEPDSVGVILDDPVGYVRLGQVALGPEGVMISRVTSTGYRGSLRDDTHFTFVIQHSGRYDVRICGRDHSMSPEGLLAFRPNDRQTQARADKAGFRSATTLQVPVARMDEITRAMETSAGVIFPQNGSTLHREGVLALGRILPQLADDLLSRSPALPPPLVAQEIRHLIEDLYRPSGICAG